MSIPGVSTDIETVITPDTDTTITGVLVGDAVTGKARGPLDSDFLVGPPLRIESGETYRVPANQQVGFRFDMQVDGDLVVDGALYAIGELSDIIQSSDGIQPTFETVSQSLAALPKTINYSLGRITTVVYTLPNASTITKTVNYTGDKITSIVLSGTTPSGIQLTKTFTYTGDKITGVSYS
jgi:hypothetical protein